MNIYDENVSLGELFHLSPESFSDMDISELPFSIRVTNRLYQQNIKTVEALLKVNSSFLMKLHGFGKNCLSQIYNLLESISNGEYESQSQPKSTIPTRTVVLQKYREKILSGDFSFVECEDLTDEDKEVIQKYEEAYGIIGNDFMEESIKNPDYVFLIMQALIQFCKKNDKYHDLVKTAEKIPGYRQKNKCKYYITAYSFDETIRKQLYQCYSCEDSTLYSIVNSIDIENRTLVDIAEKFLKWCAFDIPAQITEVFNKLYTKERVKTVIEARAKRFTLNDIGDQLNITRERVRQIELKARRSFIRYQSKERILAKIYADHNGQNIITQEDIFEVGGENSDALIYLLRTSESGFYSYDVQLDAFIVGDNDISSRIQNYIDSLPDIFHRGELQEFLEVAKEQEDIEPEFVEKAIADAYRMTGDVYHRTRLSLAKVYEEVLMTYFPNGIHVYDENEITQLRETILEKYGDLGLPENNRAIAARIASIGVLSGRGRYIAKRKQWISRELENKLLKYIVDSSSPILMVGSIFYEFEDELLQEGVDNRYFLQGILREIVGERFYFRRDYISKDRGFTSIYSSIIAYIKGHKYPVAKSEIQAKFQGITDIVITLATNDNDVLNYFGEYLHGSQLSIRDDEKTRLLEQLTVLIDDHEAHHIKDIYPVLLKDNSAVFTRNAVNGSFRAYSILEYLFREQFQFSRPYIAMNGIEIGRPAERLHELIYEEEEYTISDISDFARENHLQIQSMIDFVNSLNDKFLMRDINTVSSILTLGITENIANEIQDIIEANISETTPIRNLTCLGKFPTINTNWSEWLVYSCLNKWSDKLEVALSSNQLRQSIPLVSPKGQMDAEAFRNVSVSPVRIKVDDLDDIDDLLSGIITEDMLEDV